MFTRLINIPSDDPSVEAAIFNVGMMYTPIMTSTRLYSRVIRQSLQSKTDESALFMRDCCFYSTTC